MKDLFLTARSLYELDKRRQSSVDLTEDNHQCPTGINSLRDFIIRSYAALLIF